MTIDLYAQVQKAFSRLENLSQCDLPKLRLLRRDNKTLQTPRSGPGLVQCPPGKKEIAYLGKSILKGVADATPFRNSMTLRFTGLFNLIK